MKTVRFYDLMVDCVENGVNTTRKISDELRLELPEDFDLNDSFDMLNEKTGLDVYSFRYEQV